MEQKEKSNKDGVSAEFESSGAQIGPQNCHAWRQGPRFLRISSQSDMWKGIVAEAAIPLRKGMEAVSCSQPTFSEVQLQGRGPGGAPAASTM